MGESPTTRNSYYTELLLVTAHLILAPGSIPGVGWLRRNQANKYHDVPSIPSTSIRSTSITSGQLPSYQVKFYHHQTPSISSDLRFNAWLEPVPVKCASKNNKFYTSVFPEYRKKLFDFLKYFFNWFSKVYFPLISTDIFSLIFKDIFSTDFNRYFFTDFHAYFFHWFL